MPDLRTLRSILPCRSRNLWRVVAFVGAIASIVTAASVKPL
ncbi:hypothetical protein [Streptomyces sp. NPDC015350]